jgi:uncharacterized protein involved in exopolysaccharide biosynthesis
MDIHVTHDVNLRWAPDPRLDQILSQLSALAAQAGTLMTSITDMKAALQAKLDEIAASVAEETTVIQSVEVLLDGVVAQNAAMAQQIKDLIAQGGDASTLQPLVDSLEAQNTAIQANKGKLAAAVIRDTPAA